MRSIFSRVFFNIIKLRNYAIIWIDGDACPKAVKDLVFKTAIKHKLETKVVANQSIKIPKSNLIELIIVANKMDEADRYIVENIKKGDLVITADIPFAAQVVEKASYAINPRGELYTAQNISERLSIRNFHDDLRSTGISTGNSKSYGDKEKRLFASSFDKIIHKMLLMQKTK